MTKQELKKLSKNELIEMLAEKSTTNSLTSPRLVYDSVRKYALSEQEIALVLLVGNQNEIIGKPIMISMGTANRSLVHPRDVFREAIRQNATGLFFVHNHPSGNVNPSDEDKNLTNRIQMAGDIIGIKLLDHLVISPTKYFSFKENDIL